MDGIQFTMKDCYHPPMFPERTTSHAARIAYAVGSCVRKVELFIVGLSMRERWAFLLKAGVVVVALYFGVSRPPAQGQMRQVPVDASPQTQAVEDALQDKDLANLRLDIIAQQAQIDKLRDAQDTQRDSITALDTNWKAAMGFIAFLQAGGMFLSYKRKTV